MGPVWGGPRMHVFNKFYRESIRKFLPLGPHPQLVSTRERQTSASPGTHSILPRSTLGLSLNLYS